MSGYQVIARKYRPTQFDEVVGQEAVGRTLKNAVSSGRIAHAYMFCGPRGIGKTSTARILARALNCLAFDEPTVRPCGECDLCIRAAQGEDIDVLEIDAASNRKVDDARNLIANVSLHPARARFKVYIVDEVHMLTTEAFNALLKTLEEPPAHVKFVFATTDPQRVPATILSRCQRFDFRPIPPVRIAEDLVRIAAEEGIEAEPAALAAIAQASVGGMRDAQSLLEQLATLGENHVRLADLHELLGTVPAIRMRTLFDAMAAGDGGRTLACAAEVLDGGTDPGELLRQCMRHAHDLMVLRLQGPGASSVVADVETKQALVEQARSFSEATLVYAVTVFSEALGNARLLGEGRLFAETALARLAGHRDLKFLDSVVRDLTALERRLGGVPAAAPSGGPSAAGATTRPVGGPVPGSTPTRAPASQAASATPPQASSSSSSGSTTAATAEPARSLDEVRARWSQVLERTRGNSRLRTALEAARVHDAREGVLVLSFPPSAAFHRRSLGEKDLGSALAVALESSMGARLRVETVERAPDPEEVAAAEPKAPPPDFDRLSAAQVEAVKQAPLTKLIEEQLGGRIVHIRKER